MTRRRALVLAIVTLTTPCIPGLTPQAGAQSCPTSEDHGRVLQELNQLPPQSHRYPEVSVAVNLTQSLLQQDPCPSRSDVDAASRALDAIGSTSDLLNRTTPDSFEDVENRLSNYRDTERTIEQIIPASPAADATAETWNTVERLLLSAAQRWGTQMGEAVIGMTDTSRSSEQIERQLRGFELAETIFSAVDSPGRAAAAAAQREIFADRFLQAMERAESIRDEMRRLTRQAPSGTNLFAGIFWYDETTSTLEDAPRADSIYQRYGQEENQTAVAESSQRLAAVRADVRAGMLTVLVPLHLAIATLAGGALYVVQRYERDVEDVILGTEIALIRGSSE